MPNRTIIRTQGGVQKNLTVNRDREAGVKILTSGYVYSDTLLEASFNADGVNYTRISEQAFTVVASNSTAHKYLHLSRANAGSDRLRMGKNRVTFDITVNSGSISSFTGYYADVDADTDPPTYGNFNITEGSNVIDIEVFDDGNPTAVNQSEPKIMIRVDLGSTCDISLTNLKITHNFKQLTANRTAPVITSDRKGEPRPLLSKLVGGAEAAYSLRDLNDRNGNNKVVRVRRESDNHERDFLAKEVSNGTLENWVNTQAVLPLDIKALTDDGRTGAVADAAAAYSLRNLSSSYGGNVVHVRRNIDHQNRDFTAAQVADGTLLSFVNNDFSSSLPLDVDDTDAYRAYSLRNIVSGYSGNVVEVRRSGDSRLNSFKANEITDGTLVDFVLDNTKALLNSRAYFDASNDEVVLTSEITMSGDFSIQYSFVVTETGRGERILGRTTTYYIAAEGSGEIDKFKAQVGSSGVTMHLTSNLKYGEENTVKFKRVSGKVGIYNESDTLISNEVTVSGDFVFNAFGRARGQYARGVVYNIRIDTNNDGTIDHSYNGYGNTLSDWTDLVGSNNATAVNGSPALFTGQDQDGFVKTWYDQAQGAQHATASTGNQPKIVSNGSLITGGGLLFTGNESLEFNPLSANDLSIFTVINLENDDMVYDVIGSNSGDGVMGISDLETALYFDGSNEEEEDLNTQISTTQDTLYCMTVGQASGGTDINFFTNGQQSEQIFVSSSAATDFDSIGGAGVNAFFVGTMKEVILYDERIDTRRAVEESIAGHYGITMASFSRDGHVRTWYDQGGEGHDAIQTTPEYQPKIVENGNLLTAGVKFQGAQSLSVSGDPVITASSTGTDSTYSAFSVQTVALSESGYLYGNASVSNGSSLYASVNTFNLSNKNLVNLDNISRVVAPSGGQNLLSAVYNNGDAGLLVNGAGTMTDAGTYNFSAGTGDFVIGNRNAGNHITTFLTGSIAEIIVYNSDQSANRTAIEANIGAHYSINLPAGVDSGFDEVNGFVEKWYDQSGNNNDAVQPTAESQPMIVDAGNLNPSGGLEFNSTTRFLALTNTVSFSNLPLTMFSVQDSQPNHNHHTLGCNNSRGIGVSGNTVAYYFTGNVASLTFPSSVTGLNLYTVIHDGTTNSDNIKAHRNGVVNSSSSGNGMGQANSNTQWKNIGVRANTNDFFHGTMKELIIYRADQTANRPAIEANLANQYDITLS